MVNYAGINHLAMATNDIDKTIAFWRDLLGMRLVLGMGHDGYRHYFFEISAHDMIAFFEWPAVEPVPEKDHGVPVRGPHVFDHVSFEVESDEDLWELRDRLEGAGVWVSELVDHGFIHSVYSFDPNGIAIEFSAPVEGVNLRERPVMMDHTPSLYAREGADAVAGRWPASESTPQEERIVYPGEGDEVRAAYEAALRKAK